jgi:hypothetical protein
MIGKRIGGIRYAEKGRFGEEKCQLADILLHGFLASRCEKNTALRWLFSEQEFTKLTLFYCYRVAKQRACSQAGDKTDRPF